jgi:hypothetical protein
VALGGDDDDRGGGAGDTDGETVEPAAAAAMLIAISDAEPTWDKKVAARAKAADFYRGVPNGELDHAQALCDFARWLYQDDPRGREPDRVCAILLDAIDVTNTRMMRVGPSGADSHHEGVDEGQEPLSTEEASAKGRLDGGVDADATVESEYDRTIRACARANADASDALRAAEILASAYTMLSMATPSSDDALQ